MTTTIRKHVATAHSSIPAAHIARLLLSCGVLTAFVAPSAAQNLFLAPLPVPGVPATSTLPQTPSASPAPTAATLNAAPAVPNNPKVTKGVNAALVNGAIQPAPTPGGQGAPFANPLGAPVSAADMPPVATGVSLMAPPRLAEVSLLVVIPPEPRRFALHDKVDIIVNETSLQKHDQKLDTKKQFDLSAKLKQFPNLRELLTNATLRNGIDEDPEVGFDAKDDYKANGGYQRQDRFTARIAATVIDVKPNGLLVIEARKLVQSDRETQVMVLSGLCDPKDITKSNTVQSAQLADMTLRVSNAGFVKDSAEKGVLTNIFEKVFSF
ncbi:hypothetical protein BH11PLA1_BH11PLA1_17210 [soil metagenome]